MSERTLEELLALLDSDRERDVLDVVDEVSANLAARFDALVEPALDALASSTSWKRRAVLAAALAHVERTPRRAAVLERLLCDPHREVVIQARDAYAMTIPPTALARLRALAERGTAHEQHLRALARARSRTDEATFRAAARAVDPELARAALEALGELPGVDAASIAVLAEATLRMPMRATAAQALAQLAATMTPSSIQQLLASEPVARRTLERALDLIDPRHQPSLRAILGIAAPVAHAPNAAVAPTVNVLRDLACYGVVLDGARPEHAVRVGDAAIVHEVARLLTGSVRRSVVLVGASGVGKTSVVHAVARHLRTLSPPWPVLETSTAEVLAGTKWLGEWETRLKRLIDLARAPAKVVLYVTDVHALPTQGKSADRDGTFADVLAPYLDRGELAIVAESTEDALRRGIDRHGALRRVLERVRVPEPSVEETRAIIRGRVQHMTAGETPPVVVPPAVLDQIIETAPLHGVGVAQPGAAARLGDQVVEQARDRRRASDAPQGELVIEPSDVIGALARSTGMPRDLLDDRAPFDRARVRAFFEERVLGQREAIDLVVELVTLVKAGLSDPDRPYGSLFFVGPTGVGKTELAKALAEHLYGSAERMVRIDMSELRDWDSYERLIGSVRNPAIEGQLTKRVTESPFSVVLLDEIEKAHPNVHDILLQLLDDGRLTDARGRTTDFRRTVVVMTSNVGARIEVDALGFGATGGQAASEEAVLREVRRVFRPELVNRFGRIVVFKPLGPDIIRTIARRELGKVILRSGVLRRRLAVDLAPEVVDLLAREGFSAAYGARPLKRRVERRVLLPLAERIVTLGPDAAGTILRVEATGGDIVVRAIAPPASDGDGRVARPSELRDRGALRGRLAAIATRAAAIAVHPRHLAGIERREELMQAFSHPTFWDDADRARASMTELADLDDREAARAALDRRIEGVGELVRDGAKSAPLAAKAHAALDDIERALTMLELRTYVESRVDRADVVLVLARVGNASEAGELVLALASMYEAWAAAHDARALRIDESRDDAGTTSVAIHLSGHGLFGALRGEAGLHRLADVGRGRDRRSAAVRMTVLACPETPPAVRIEHAPKRRGRTRVTAHHASGLTIEVELPSRPAIAAAEIDAALAAWIGARLAGPGETRDAVVRRYGVEDRYAVDESTGQRFRTKDLPTTGLDVVFEARARARLDDARATQG
jgi:ATP-dependent Clp protease ATP-binding subunit ClpC